MSSLGCLWNRPRLERLVDGELGGRIARRVEAHVVSCERCLGRVQANRRLRVLVQAAAVDPGEPDWQRFWPGIQAKIASGTVRPVRDAWWLPLWHPFWGHPRLALGGVLTGSLALALFFWPAGENPSSVAWADPVIVQDVSTPDPDRSVMVYSSADQTLTVIWLFNSSGSADESS